MSERLQRLTDPSHAGFLFGDPLTVTASIDIDLDCMSGMDPLLWNEKGILRCCQRPPKRKSIFRTAVGPTFWRLILSRMLLYAGTSLCKELELDNSKQTSCQ